LQKTGNNTAWNTLNRIASGLLVACNALTASEGLYFGLGLAIFGLFVGKAACA
jgi:hypothetical protein